MSNRRLISSDLFEDEFIGGLDIFSRYLWVGLITACADDQGRLLANPSVIRAKIFPFDDYSLQDIDTALRTFVHSGKLIAYQAGGKKLYQIASWWKHQAPSWASPSKYIAPAGWVDRVKVHAKDNKVTMLNWNIPGGLPTPVPTPVPTGINEGEGEGEGDDEGEGEGAGAPPNPPASPPFVPQLRSAIAFELIRNATGWPAIPASWKDDVIATIEAVYYQRKDTALEEMQCAFREWTRREYNATNPGWVEWVIGGIPPDNRKNGKKNGKKTIAEDLQALQNLIDEEAANVTDHFMPGFIPAILPQLQPREYSRERKSLA